MQIDGLGSKLRHLLHLLDGDVQAIYDAEGLAFRPRFYPIVRKLQTDGPQRVADLADAIGVSQPAVTQTIAEMTKLGLVESRAGPDRRVRLIELTGAGEAMLGRLERIWMRVHDAARGLDAELDAPLGAILDQAIAALHHTSFRERIGQ